MPTDLSQGGHHVHRPRRLSLLYGQPTQLSERDISRTGTSAAGSEAATVCGFQGEVARWRDEDSIDGEQQRVISALLENRWGDRAGGRLTDDVKKNEASES
jgi:hypothetical protein